MGFLRDDYLRLARRMDGDGHRAYVPWRNILMAPVQRTMAQSKAGIKCICDVGRMSVVILFDNFIRHP